MKKNQMFHKKWGNYIHTPDPDVFTDSNPANFSPDSYRHEMLDILKMEVIAELFAPNHHNYKHFASAVKVR